MEHSLHDTDKIRSFLKKYKYHPVDKSLTPDKLTKLNLYQKIAVGNKISYTLFHKKGSPISAKIPASLYIAEEDLDAYLDFTSSREPSSRPEPEQSNSMLSGNYEKTVLNNPDLTPEKKIDLTLQCAGEVMSNIFEKSELDPAHIESIRHVGDNLNRFIQTVISEKNEESLILEKLIGHDYYTYNHSIHVTLYCGIMAGEMAEQNIVAIRGSIRYLCLGALMHDIGKIRVDQSIITKNGRLTAQEFEHIKKHPSYGAEIATDAREHPDVVTVIREHHEQWGGEGYPLGLKGEKISEIGRIAAICDVFDALTTNRTYRAAMLPFDALSLMLRTMRNNFYPPYLQFFIKFLGRMAR